MCVTHLPFPVADLRTFSGSSREIPASLYSRDLLSVKFFRVYHFVAVPLGMKKSAENIAPSGLLKHQLGDECSTDFPENVNFLFQVEGVIL